MPTWLYILLGFLAAVALLMLVSHLRFRRTAAARAGETIDDFREAFAGRSVPDEVITMAYRKIQEWTPDVKKFPVRATDDLRRFYGIVDEDLDDLGEQLLTACGRKPPSHDDLEGLPEVVTVFDLVMFVAGCEVMAAAVNHESK